MNWLEIAHVSASLITLIALAAFVVRPLIRVRDFMRDMERNSLPHIQHYLELLCKKAGIDYYRPGWFKNAK